MAKQDMTDAPIRLYQSRQFGGVLKFDTVEFGDTNVAWGMVHEQSNASLHYRRSDNSK